MEKIDANGKLIGVVSYFSKSLQGGQKNYQPRDLDLLAIIEALSHFKYMLHGIHFILCTDHISLLSAQNNNEPSRRVKGWLNELAEYDFQLKYLPSPKIVVADTISRANYTIAAINTDVVCLNLKNWYDSYFHDTLCAAVVVYFEVTPESNLTINDTVGFKKCL